MSKNDSILVATNNEWMCCAKKTCLGFFIPEEMIVKDVSSKVLIKLNEHMKKLWNRVACRPQTTQLFSKKQVKKNLPSDAFVQNVQEE